MKYLVLCPCGHSLENHGQTGCDSGGGCPCDHSQQDALDAAIDEARRARWPMWGVEDASA